MEQALAAGDAPERVVRRRAARARVHTPGVGSLAVTQRLAGMRILVVDPSDGMRAFLGAFLASLGVRHVETASQGDEAARRLAAAAHDVVLCEYRLGSGRNGQQLLEEARIHGWISPATVWLMISSERRSEMISGAAELGPDEYLIKPVSEQTLEARLLRLVERKAGLAQIVGAMRAGNYEAALELVEQRLTEGDAGGRLDVLRLQAQIHTAQGRPDRASTVYEGILREREVAWAKLALAQLYGQAGNLAEAAQMLRELIARFPRYVQAYDVLAKIYEESGDVASNGLPMRLLQRAARISPNSAKRQSALGTAALHAGVPELALQAFSRSIRLAEQSALKDPAAHVGLVRACVATGRGEQALDALAVMQQSFDDPAARLAATTEEARVQHLLGRADATEAAAWAAHELVVHAAAQVSVGQVLDASRTLMAVGQVGVVTELLQFVARNHYDEPALIAQAQSVFEVAGLGEQGHRLLDASRQQATEAMSEGVGLLARGAFREAVQSLGKARQLMPRNPRVLLNYVSAIVALLERSGRQPWYVQEAQASIDMANRISPAEPRAQELQERLRLLAA